MARYRCTICGYIYDEAKEGKSFDSLGEDWACPVCTAPKTVFKAVEEETKTGDDDSSKTGNALDYDPKYKRDFSDVENHMADIHSMAVSGETIIGSMSTGLPIISWDDVLFLGAQLNPLPLDEDAHVSTTTIIGKTADKPLIIENPVFISHMSFGALSRELKIALAKGSAMSRTATCSGEGGILPEEMDAAYRYIFEYVPNLYSVTDENLKKSDAIEIKIGQGTKPGMGGMLPAGKVTEEIAKIRSKPLGKNIISPSKFPGVNSKEDLRHLVEEIRYRSEGRPVGIKIAAGHIERDMEFIAYARPDFVTVDGRGGATGASPKLFRDATSVPTLFALYRTKKYITEHDLDIDVVITGGLRVSSDFAKAIAMGADAVAIATAAMTAAACQQYRICSTGKCPVGCATQDPELRKRLDIDKSAQRVANFLNVSLDELRTYARISGHNNIHDLSVEDLCTANSEISDYTNIRHV